MLSRLCPGPGPAPVYWNLSPVLDTANLRLLLWITGAQWPLNRPPPAPVTRPVCAIALMTETVLNKSSISFWLLDHVTTHNIFIYLLLAMSWISTMIDYCLRIRPVSPSVVRLSGVELDIVFGHPFMPCTVQCILKKYKFWTSLMLIVVVYKSIINIHAWS